jgi:SET domain-containing protein
MKKIISLIFLIIIILSIIISNYIDKLYNSNSYILKETPIYYNIDTKLGRGVFATKNLRNGQRIELSPTIEVENVSGTLKNYVFGKDGKEYVAFGCGSMFNHSDKPNVNWSFNPNNDLLFVANKNIKKGEQLFINYGVHYWKNRKQDKINI